MKIISHSLAVAFLGLVAMSAAAHAHGLHPEVPPQFHIAVHLLQFVGAVALAFAIGVWAGYRTGARRGNSTNPKQDA